MFVKEESLKYGESFYFFLSDEMITLLNVLVK